MQPFAPVLVDLAGAESAVTDYPYLEGADLRATHEPRIVATWEEDVPLVVAAAPRRRRSALGWWIAGAAVILLAVVIAVVSSQRSTDVPLADPSPSGTVTAGSAAGVGSPVAIDVPAAGQAQLTLTVPADGTYFVEGVSEADIALVIDADGATPWSSDDRGAALVDVMGGSWKDPGVFAYLTAGDHTVQLTEHTGAAAAATVSVYEAQTTDVTVGQPLDLRLADGEYVVLRLQLDTETPLVVDVRANDTTYDPRMITFETGAPVESDDRGAAQAASIGGSEYDPYLSATFPAGTSYLVISEWSMSEVALSVNVTPAS